MKEAYAFSPGHLTGFFQICDDADDPLLKGSRGAGFSTSLGIITRVRTESVKSNSLTIRINGETTKEAIVSQKVVERMISAQQETWRIQVEHEVQIPIGSGFGSSGGGALSLALALNEALDLDMSRIEAAQVAHAAEIECRTGLGTVLAELSGGFGVTIKPGAPGIGETVRFRQIDDIAVVCLPFGPIPTWEALSNHKLRCRINKLGGGFVDKLYRVQSKELFMQLSRRFSEYIGLITPRLRSVLKKTDKLGIPCSMAMFGEVIFSLVDSELKEKLVNVLKEESQGQKVIEAEIDERGAHLL
jgi:pantoate kinase